MIMNGARLRILRSEVLIEKISEVRLCARRRSPFDSRTNQTTSREGRRGRRGGGGTTERESTRRQTLRSTPSHHPSGCGPHGPGRDGRGLHIHDIVVAFRVLRVLRYTTLFPTHRGSSGRSPGRRVSSIAESLKTAGFIGVGESSSRDVVDVRPPEDGRGGTTAGRRREIAVVAGDGRIGTGRGRGVGSRGR